VYDHEVKDFRRVSPVAMVHSDGTQTLHRADEFNYSFIVSLWWKRSSDGGDTEDTMDDLSDAIYALLLSQNNLLVDENFSRMSYPVVDGVMYRREEIRVIM
jgi:ankyrin repeat protein